MILTTICTCNEHCSACEISCTMCSVITLMMLKGCHQGKRGHRQSRVISGKSEFEYFRPPAKKKLLKVKKMLLSSTMGNVGSMQRIFRAHPRDKKIWISLKFLTILCKNLSERDAFLGADLFYSTRIYKTLKTLSESPLILD